MQRTGGVAQNVGAATLVLSMNTALLQFVTRLAKTPPSIESLLLVFY